MEVVLSVAGSPLALEPRTQRRLNLRASKTQAASERIEAVQSAVEARIVRAIPSAQVRWRYRIVANALAVVVPKGDVTRLVSVPGVRHVYPNVWYRPQLDQSVPLIGAPALWGPGLATAGTGMKIGIIDDGVDQSHPFFSPAGFTMPAGFPKGQTAYTTAKVIVARAFAPPSTTWKYAKRPFDPENSDHATHVAGIAAGDHDTTAGFGGVKLSGVAPRAYIGNYKVLTVPTPGVGLNGNAAEIAAGIEAAVRDGMDVINLSLGEPEIEPSRDLVVQAINGAARAGVVPVVAAGNDFTEFGFGSVSSPGSAAGAITVAAATKARDIADFSSGGPTPISLELKPEVTAPGAGIYSSVPERLGTWEMFSGTSMAAPHVAGGAALLRERHPTWTVEQLKSALVLTGKRVDGFNGNEALVTREGGGMIDLPAANKPLFFSRPATISYRILPTATHVSGSVKLEDAGGGAGVWNATLAPQTRNTGVTIDIGVAAVAIPGQLKFDVSTAGNAPDQNVAGFVVLRRGSLVRRIPYWFRVSKPKLAGEPHLRLRRGGEHSGNTARGVARVSWYRYPEAAPGVATSLNGPERVFRFQLRRPVANFGVVVVSRARGVGVEPRVVLGGDENRLTGYAGLPIDLNPYREDFGRPIPVAGALRPKAGAYDIVFDETSRRQAGRFRFRFWVNDVRPPAIRVLSRVVGRSRVLRIRVVDSGSGVDASTLTVEVAGQAVDFGYRRGVVTVDVGWLSRGRHPLVVRAADWQESKNMENVPPILPNTRTVRTSFRVR